MNNPSEKLVASLAQNQPDLSVLAYLGHRAPSVHNTQPWLFKINPKNNSIKIILNPEHNLPHSDPALRQTWISIGAALENIKIALESCRLPYNVHDGLDGPTIKIGDSTKPLDADQIHKTVETILIRATNRYVYSQKTIDDSILRKLESLPETNSRVKTILVTDSSAINRVAEMIFGATKLALSSVTIRSEIGKHINAPHRPRHTGIPATALSPMHSALFEKFSSNSNAFVKNKARAEADKISAAPALALVFTASDTRKDWLAAGQIYEQLCLRATQLGLSHSTHAALVEAPDYYKEVSELFDTPMRLQAMVRLGYGPANHGRSKRLPLERVLHTADDF